MQAWKSLCEALDVGSLVPDQFADYRQPITDGLTYFLEHLSLPRQARILADQATLGMSAPLEQRLVSVARHCPTLQKLGQVLARDRRLSADLRHLLQGLESAPPAMSGDQARSIVASELGDLDAFGISIDDEPIAEASMAVVIPFIWQHSGSTRRGVFKLLKPDIEKHLEEELQLLGEVGAFLDQRCESYGIPNIAYGELFAQVRELLGNEVDLSQEQANMESARIAYLDTRGVIVPKLFPFCTGRVTAMERIDGIKVTDLGDAVAVNRRRIASRMIDALIGHPVWSTNETSMFHADPHAGNLLVTEDRQLAILDWGLVGKLSKQERIDVSLIMIGAVTHDASRILDAVMSLANDAVDHDELKVVVEDALQSIRRGNPPGLHWLTGLMDDAVSRAGVSFTADLLLFRKVLLVIDGVLADVAEDYAATTSLAASFAMRLGGDWTKRVRTMPFNRESATHLSNADLLKLLGSGPGTAVRFWRGMVRDLVTETFASRATTES